MCDPGTVNMSELTLDFLLTSGHTKVVSSPQTQQAHSSLRELALDSSLSGILCP